jgi:hypothetical protein
MEKLTFHKRSVLRDRDKVGELQAVPLDSISLQVPWPAAAIYPHPTTPKTGMTGIFEKVSRLLLDA